MLVAAAIMAALAALIAAILVAGPDRTLTGLATKVEAHEICVARADGSPDCAHVDYPGQLDGLSVGDCVEVKRSGEGILESVRQLDTCS